MATTGDCLPDCLAHTLYLVCHHTLFRMGQTRLTKLFTPGTRSESVLGSPLRLQYPFSTSPAYTDDCCCGQVCLACAPFLDVCVSSLFGVDLLCLDVECIHCRLLSLTQRMPHKMRLNGSIEPPFPLDLQCIHHAKGEINYRTHTQTIFNRSPRQLRRVQSHI